MFLLYISCTFVYKCSYVFVLDIHNIYACLPCVRILERKRDRSERIAVRTRFRFPPARLVQKSFQDEGQARAQLMMVSVLKVLAAQTPVLTAHPPQPVVPRAAAARKSGCCANLWQVKSRAAPSDSTFLFSHGSPCFATVWVHLLRLLSCRSVGASPVSDKKHPLLRPTYSTDYPNMCLYLCAFSVKTAWACLC